MVIECSCCRARYRMKESMMRGFKGAEVRCRKCGGTIAVMTPGTTSRTPAAQDPDDRPFMERKEPSPGLSRHGLGGGEGKSRTRTVLAEDTDAVEPVPDNVYPLDFFRGGRPKRLPTGGYDISDSIRPGPSVPPAGRKSSDRSPSVAEPPGESRSVRSILFEEPIRWRKEGIASAPPEGAPAAPDESTDPGKSAAYKSRAPGGFSLSAYPHPTHIAIVYLLLLFLGGFGYLIVRFFSHVINGGGG